MESIKSIKTLSELFQFIPCVDLDPSGTFKYIQIKASVKTKGSEDSVTFIRGYSRFEYHMEIFENFSEELKLKKELSSLLYKPKEDEDGVQLLKVLKLKCPGGGRIKHERKKLLV